MSEFELQQLQDNQQIINGLNGLNEGINTVSQSVYEIQDMQQQVSHLSDQVSHLSDQLDLSHQTVYSLGQYASTMTILLILCAGCLLFLIGHKVVKG